MATADLNSVTLIGNLTRDSELRDAGNAKVLQFSLAVNETVKEGENWTTRPNYIDVTLFGKRGESLAQYLVKGQKVAVLGSIHQDRWEKEGVKNQRIVIRASEVQLVGGRSEGSAPKAPAPQQSSGVPGFDSEIPW